MTPIDRSSPRAARLPTLGAREWLYALPDGGVLGLGAEEVGAEEGIAVVLFDPGGRELARIERRLWLGMGFLTDPRPIGPLDLAFEFPAGLPWRLSVRPGRPGWLTRLGGGPLRLSRAGPG